MSLNVRIEKTNIIVPPNFTQPVNRQNYTIKENDTLWDIAKKKYGNAKLWPLLTYIRENKKCFKNGNPNNLIPGTVLKLDSNLVKSISTNNNVRKAGGFVDNLSEANIVTKNRIEEYEKQIQEYDRQLKNIQTTKNILIFLQNTRETCLVITNMEVGVGEVIAGAALMVAPTGVTQIGGGVAFADGIVRIVSSPVKLWGIWTENDDLKNSSTNGMELIGQINDSAIAGSVTYGGNSQVILGMVGDIFFAKMEMIKSFNKIEKWNTYSKLDKIRLVKEITEGYTKPITAVLDTGKKLESNYRNKHSNDDIIKKDELGN